MDRNFTAANRTISSLSEQPFYWIVVSTSLEYFNRFVVVAALVFGFFGNALSVAIFFTRRHQDKASAGYLGPLAVFDFWNVCIGVFFWLVQGAWKISNGTFGLSSYADTDVNCWLAWFFTMFAMFLSGWTIVAFSTERLLVVWFPIKMTSILTPQIRRKVILCLLMCAPMFVITIVTEPGYFDNYESTTKCCPVKYGTPKILEVLFWFVCVGMCAGLPCLLVSVINALILAGLRRNGREMDNNSKVAAKNERRCLKNLLVVSTFYLIFMSPFSVFWSFISVTRETDPKLVDLAFYSLNWSTLNYCINPILYCFSLPYYREDAIRILTCGLIPGDNAKYSQSSVQKW